ncbi:MAG TPA: type IV pilin protein [Steroidobacteraceae bacterium]|nr:type IV pilin protein [Steroidobacteraceae bacterium]
MKRNGFSLIELMVVVTIVAILASIAVPAYTSSVRKSRRTEAKTAITDLAAREERYFATQNVYSADPIALQYAAAGSGASWPIAVGSYYSISSITVGAATATTPGTYTLQITPSAGSPQLQDTSCQVFQVDQTGKQSSQDSGGNDSSSTCWP